MLLMVRFFPHQSQRVACCLRNSPGDLFSLSVLAAFLGDIALDEEDLRFLKANYMDATENDPSNISIPDSGEYGYKAQTAASM